MFEEYIAHGRDLVRRIQAEAKLSEAEVDKLPAWERVLNVESSEWYAAVEERIRSSFGPDAVARYRLFWRLWEEEIKHGLGTERMRTVNLYQRIINYLVELDARPRGDPDGAGSPEA